MGNMTAAYDTLGTAVMVCIAVLIVACLIRSVLGPRVADRVVAVNSIGTMTIVIIALLSVMLEEAYLLDVCLIYAMISFVAVVVLTKIYTGVYREEKSEEDSEVRSEANAEEANSANSKVKSEVKREDNAEEANSADSEVKNKEKAEEKEEA